MFDSITVKASKVENGLEIPKTLNGERGVHPGAISEDDVVGLALGKPREDNFANRRAMRMESFADDGADGEDGCGGIDAVKTDDAA